MVPNTINPSPTYFSQAQEIIDNVISASSTKPVEDVTSPTTPSLDPAAPAAPQLLKKPKLA